MKTKPAVAVVFVAVLAGLLFCAEFAFKHPVRPKARAQRIQSVNRAPWTLTFAFTNAPGSNTDAFPSRVSN